MMRGFFSVQPCQWPVLIVLVIAQPAWSKAEPPNDESPSLNVLLPGVLDRGTAMFDAVGTHSPLGVTYRIELVNAAPKRSAPGLLQYLKDAESDPPGTKSWRVTNPTDPKVQTFLAQIAKDREATVVVDMDLSTLSASQWRAQSQVAASLVARLATLREEAYPASSNTLLSHSAGSLILSELHRRGQAVRFQNITAASPQRIDLPPWAIISLAAGDLGSTPTGSLTDITWKDAASRDIEGWIRRGNTVVVQEDSRFYLKAHTRTVTLGEADSKATVYAPVLGERLKGVPPPPVGVQRVELSNVSLHRIVHAIQATTAAGRSGSPSVRTPADGERLERLLSTLEPPRSGGVALWGACRLDEIASNVSRATWDSARGRIILSCADGQSFALPHVDRELLRCAYRCVYQGDGRDPEVSIGVNPEAGRPTPSQTLEGHTNAYYLGGVEGTVMGHLLLQGDLAAAGITYGDSAQLQARRLTDFHSLPELFPAKYADQPLQALLLGEGERLTLESLSLRIVDGGRGDLEFALERALELRFGRTTPAEQACTDLFRAHYFEILKRVPELQAVVECARAVGLMKMLRASNIPLVAHDLSASPKRVHTPHQIKYSVLAELKNIAPRAPYVIYNALGPETMVYPSGLRVEVEYSKGCIHRLHRSDGRALRVFRDALGAPIAIEVQGRGAGAFVRLEEGGIEFVDGIQLKGKACGGVEYTSQSDACQVPTENPEDVIRRLAARFMMESG